MKNKNKQLLIIIVIWSIVIAGLLLTGNVNGFDNSYLGK